MEAGNSSRVALIVGCMLLLSCTARPDRELLRMEAQLSDERQDQILLRGQQSVFQIRDSHLLDEFQKACRLSRRKGLDDYTRHIRAWSREGDIGGDVGGYTFTFEFLGPKGQLRVFGQLYTFGVLLATPVGALDLNEPERWFIEFDSTSQWVSVTKKVTEVLRVPGYYDITSGTNLSVNFKIKPH